MKVLPLSLFGLTVFSSIRESYVDNVTFFEWALYENVAPEEDYYVYVSEDGQFFITVNKVEGAHDAYFTLAAGVTKEDVENALYEEYNDNYEKVQFWLDKYASEPVYTTP